MKLSELKIVIENLRGSYKKFADTLEEYPILGVTFPTHYGYIDGYIGEDSHDLDVFLGSGNIYGIMKVRRKDVVGGLETKFIIYVTKEEYQAIYDIYLPVIESVNQVSEKKILETLSKFKAGHRV